MIKKLRNKFILIAMLSLTLVISIIIGFINIRNYTNIKNKADEKLEIIINNNGIFPRNKDEENPFSDKKMSPEAPFETRYFSVFLDANGNIIKTNTDRIKAIDEDIAKEYTLLLYSKNKTSGFYKNYRYLSKELNNETIYVFVDCFHDLTVVKDFLITSIIISLIGIISIFILVYFSSKMVFKPVNESYNKQKSFITNASHDLKTPLTVIDASCECLEMETGENEWTISIKKQIQKLSKLTEDLLLLSRIDEANSKVLFTDFSLSEILIDSIEQFKPLAIKENITIQSNINNNVTFNGDINMMYKLFELLLDNALKYCNKNGEIKISLTSDNKNQKIIFYNTCDDIEIGNLNYLLERFYRKDTSRNSNIEGHGIGLSIVKSIVDFHKGKINIKSEDGKSIIFTIML